MGLALGLVGPHGRGASQLEDRPLRLEGVAGVALQAVGALLHDPRAVAPALEHLVRVRVRVRARVVVNVDAGARGRVRARGRVSWLSSTSPGRLGWYLLWKRAPCK